MRLNNSHMGKKVNLNNDIPLVVIAVHDDEVWCQTESGGHTTFDADGDWEIIEEPKNISRKPSERINELMGPWFFELNLSPLNSQASIPMWSKALQQLKDAIGKVLDEEFEERQEKK